MEHAIVDTLVKDVRKALADAGLHADGSMGAYGPSGLLEVRDAPGGRWLFAVGMRWSDFNLRAGISRQGETIIDSWPHDDGGHVDGRCFLFTHVDQGRRAAFLEALDREIGMHRALDADGLARSLARALPGAEPDDLRAVASALGAGLDPDAFLRMAGRIEALAAGREASDAPSP